MSKPDYTVAVPLPARTAPVSFGDKSTRWVNIGVAFKGKDEGIRVLIDALPLPGVGWEGVMYLFPKGNEERE